MVIGVIINHIIPVRISGMCIVLFLINLIQNTRFPNLSIKFQKGKVSFQF